RRPSMTLAGSAWLSRSKDASRATSFKCFFFFQAEDGIRDLTVTGVQTCALPISEFMTRAPSRMTMAHVGTRNSIAEAGRRNAERSEERRVGKECRSRWWRAHDKKKQDSIQREVLEVPSAAVSKSSVSTSIIDVKV